MVEETDFGASFDRVFEAVHDRPGSFFLDSAQPAGTLGEYSFIGFDPFLSFRARGDRGTIAAGGKEDGFSGDPLAELRRLSLRFRSGPAGKLPFAGGAVGYFSYELCALMEDIRRTGPGDGAMPDAEFGFYDGILAFEHASGRAFLVANPVYRDSAKAILERLGRTVRQGLGLPRAVPASGPGAAARVPQPQMGKARYLAAVRRIQAYIASGDVYQVNLTQRFDSALDCHPHALYRRLRRRSPAPFAVYLNFGPLQVVSSSPERFLRLRDGRVETRPIKGTRPRGRTPEEDARLRAELLSSAKDRAELLMIVDLERNDLGRVCEFGSVRVDDLFRLESHPTVHHLVASVSGSLRPGLDVFDCVRAMFPGGSITGAPKIRAMQIIDEVEPCRRNLYTGAIGYLGFDGAADLNIAIRTILCSGGRASYHVGGGIVWDSDPGREYQECLDKGRAMFESLSGPGPGRQP